MLGFVKSILSGKPSSIPESRERDPKRYQKEREQAASDKKKDRMVLAKSSKTHQEILYYLAESDPDKDVRKAVAANPITPIQAGEYLAKDSDPDVRMTLVRRLVNLLPELSQEKHSKIYAYATQALGLLALDEVLKIRVALSSSLKDIAQTPPKIANTLARDIERQVAEPILRFCSALSDEDLIDIIASHPENWAVEAVAGRESVSTPVSEAVIDTENVKAGEILMENSGAAITEELLRHILDKAKHIPEWQSPIARRSSLPPEMAKELAAFAQKSVQHILTARPDMPDMDEETREEIAQAFDRRLGIAHESQPRDNSLKERVQKLSDENRLNEETLLDYLGMRDKEMAMAVLAGLAKTSPGNVSRIMAMKAAKPTVALCWQAGISMRAALQIEKDLAQVAPKELIYPREGSEYPMEQDEILWQLEFLGLKAA